jgi:CheY-like chemotaxis protein
MRMNSLVILVVDDNDDDVTLLQRAFAKADLMPPQHVVDNGEAAIAYLAGEGPYADRARYPLPTLLLLDLKLPRRSGLEVLTWLRQQPGLKHLPVIVFTTSQQPADVDRAYEQGANSYVVKPDGFDALLTLVQALQAYWGVWNIPPHRVAHTSALTPAPKPGRFGGSSV